MVKAAVDATIDTFVQEYIPKGSSDRSKRVGRRFGLVAAGGELAIYFGIIPWKKGSAKSGAGKCLTDWLEHRGDDQDIEEKQILLNSALL